MAYEKTAKRTLRWAHCCMFVNRQLQHMQTLPEGQQRKEYREQLVDYVNRNRNLATEEGYDDTATYLQHVLDDLK